MADYILLATATSSTHVRALADEVDEKLSSCGIEPHHIEGRSTGWILLDYNEVIITKILNCFFDAEKQLPNEFKISIL